MASTYTRHDSQFIHIRFKDEAGAWRGKPTGYRKDNLGDARQAKLMARKLTEQDRIKRPTGSREHWERWVPQWMEDRYAARENQTLIVYTRHWRRLFAWLKGQLLLAPRQFIYQHALEYRAQRRQQGAGNNTVIGELKFFSMVLGEAMKRGFCDANPCVRMGLSKTKAADKIPWTDEELARAIELADELGSAFISVTLILGLYQAARLRQCAVPLRDVDLDGGRVTYWKTIDGKPLTKGDKPFTQPLDPRAIPRLRKIVNEQKSKGRLALCEIPDFASIIWREFLDLLGFKHLVHHGLRVTWITRAALSRGRVSLAEAKRFVNHGSTAVHELYQKLSAEDLAHVPSAMNLPEIPQAHPTSRAEPPTNQGSAKP